MSMTLPKNTIKASKGRSRCQGLELPIRHAQMLLLHYLEARDFGPLTDSLDEFAVSGKKVTNSL
jgi:hypothetical protein